MAKDILDIGSIVLDHTPDPEKYKNDNIHPVVRYIPGGFAGHDWWMVTTPYPESNNRLENPCLYWGDSEPDGSPPKQFHGGVVVAEAPGELEEPPSTQGYNSDGCLYYEESSGKLWIFWRECISRRLLNELRPFTKGRATFGVWTLDGVTFSEQKLFAPLGFNTDPGISYPNRNGDAEMSPIVLERNGEIKLYGSLYQYSYGSTAWSYPYGIAKWDLSTNDLDTGVFTNTRPIGQHYWRGKDYWHIDFCDAPDGKYLMVATPQSGREIWLGISDDGDNFTFWETPILNTNNSGGSYYYKASIWVKDGIFYLWYPNRRNPYTGEQVYAPIWMTSMPYEQLIAKLNATVNTIKGVSGPPEEVIE